MISLSGLVHAVILLVVGGIICWLLWWLIGFVGLPEPFAKVARVLIAVVAVLICIFVLLTLAGIQVFAP